MHKSFVMASRPSVNRDRLFWSFVSAIPIVETVEALHQQSVTLYGVGRLRFQADAHSRNPTRDYSIRTDWHGTGPIRSTILPLNAFLNMLKLTSE